MQETRKSIAATVACLLTYTAISPSLADPINLLREFRPIGSVGNNLENSNLDAVRGSPELTLAPLNFAPGMNEPLVSGPKPRLISNVIAGGTGANGQNAETTDPVISAWLYGSTGLGGPDDALVVIEHHHHRSPAAIERHYYDDNDNLRD